MALLATLSGRFVSIHAETWQKDGAEQRRDTLNVLDERTGQVFACQPPRDGSPGLHPVVVEARSLKFGDPVHVAVEQRAYVASGARFATTSYVAHDIKAAATAGAKG